MDVNFLLAMVVLVLFLLLILLYMYSYVRLSEIHRPWRRRKNRREIKNLSSYVNRETNEFEFVQLMIDAGSPIEWRVGEDCFRLPWCGEFLEFNRTECTDKYGRIYSVMNELSLVRVRMPLEYFFRSCKKVWCKDAREISRVFWIDGSLIGIENRVYLNYDAVHAIFFLCERG